MSAATDHFIGFLDLLAAAVQDDGATGSDLYDRLYLSRHHLSRVVASVAGEPPAALRRRVLLERSAYRLLTTRRPVLDVAVEAGYGSHEAFTRAFSRAYGVAPAIWRTRPGQVRLDAPNDVHFHPPGGLRLPGQQRVTAMNLLTAMVEHHVWLTGEMIANAERLDEARLDQPIEVSVDDDRQSIRTLLSRLVGQMGMWNAALADRDYDWSVEDHESITSLRRRLADEGPTYLAHVRTACDEGRLEDTFVDALCNPAEVFTYGGMIAHVLTFAAHRRTLVALALKAHGVEDLGWGDPIRWVAEHGS